MRREARSGGWATLEFVVASLISLLLIAAAMQQLATLRQVQRRALRRSENSQAARAATMRMRRLISRAGLAVRPGGDAQHPDEPIEGAWSGGLMVRGDFDRASPAAAIPEQTLAGAAPYEHVTTGNDEIVGWFLGDGQGGTNANEQLSFVADVEGVPRDASSEEVTISRIALQQGTPPYTLYRVHVRDDSRLTTRRPIIDGVHRLHFEYFDAEGRAIAPPGGGEDAAARAARGRIRSIAISIEIDSEVEGRIDRGEPSEHWRFVIAPSNLALPSRPDL